MRVEVAGPGCPRCVKTEENVKEAIRQLGIEAQVDHVYDVRAMAKKGVTLTPAVLVDGKVVISGKIPSVEELKKVLTKK